MKIGKYVLGPCAKELGCSFLCEFSEACEYGKTDTSKCTNALALGWREELQQFKNSGLTAIGVEMIIEMLNSTSINVRSYREKERTIPLKEITKEHLFYPLLIPPEKEHFAKNSKFNLRASEGGCFINRIISKINRENLPFEYKKHSSMVEGEFLHRITNTQHCEDFIHNHEFPPRGEYCEKTILYNIENKIRIKGTLDCLLKVGDEHGIAVIDFKRSVLGWQGNKRFLRQEFIYARGAAQILGFEPEFYYLITVGRSFYDISKPFLIISRISAKSPMITQLEVIIFKSYEEQARLLDKGFLNYKQNMEKKNVCIRKDGRVCFDKQICDWLAARMKSSNKTLREILKELNQEHHFLPEELVLPTSGL